MMDQEEWDAIAHLWEHPRHASPVFVETEMLATEA